MRSWFALLLFIGALTISSCSTSSGYIGDRSKTSTGDAPLRGVAEIARSFGNRIPANEDLIRLLKLPTDNDGRYHLWQFAVSSKDDDIRLTEVSDTGEVIILMRINTRPGAFERYSHLTSTSGELRCTVYTSYGSREQTVVAPGDARYQTAVEDFSAQLSFWTSRERAIKAKFPSGSPRQVLGEALALR